MLSNAEQKLLQKLVYDLLKECISYVRAGSKRSFRKQQFNFNMIALREIDVAYLVTAGFGSKRIRKIREVINRLLSGDHGCFMKTKRLRLLPTDK